MDHLLLHIPSAISISLSQSPDPNPGPTEVTRHYLLLERQCTPGCMYEAKHGGAPSKPSTQEVDGGGSQVQVQPGLHRKALLI